MQPKLNFERNVIEMLIQSFSFGVDYGQFLAEEERDKEDAFEGMMGSIYARKTNLPLESQERRKPHSDEWRTAKLNSFERYIELLQKVVEQ